MKADPFRRLRGWRELGEQVGDALDRVPDEDRTFLIGPSRTLAAEMAFYVPGQPRVFATPRRRITSQYHLWPGPTECMGWDAILVLEEHKKLPAGLEDCFESLALFESVVVRLGPKAERRYSLYLGESLKRWESPALEN